MTTMIASATTLGVVRLTVADLAAQSFFYERTIGLIRLREADDLVVLGSLDGTPIVELVGRQGAPPRPGRTTGLFHLAILVPSRAELARTVRRVTDAGWRFSGGSDHLVSEAMYLNDPEGNGIELYRDRPRAEWRWTDGDVAMDTLPIDLDGVMAEAPADADAGMAPGTVLGHVHLNVADLAAAETFWSGIVGFDVVVRGYPGALFVSAGGYHHHLGLNTWYGVGAPAAPAGSRGLDRFEILVDGDDLAGILARAESAGIATETTADGTLIADPSQNRALLVTR
jgi:catechol 2,3-dioxygenase